MEQQQYLENRPYDELQVGDMATYQRTVTEKDIKLFAILSGDLNPLHIDPEYAKTTQFGEPIAHGAFVGVVLSAAIATHLPGPGSVYLSQEAKFKKPVKAGDTLHVTLEVIRKLRRNIIKLQCTMTNQREEMIFTGVSTVLAPAEKMKVAIPSRQEVLAGIDFP